jgi:hypothetical protein
MKKILQLAALSTIFTTINFCHASTDPVTDQTRRNWANDEYDHLFYRGVMPGNKKEIFDKEKNTRIFLLRNEMRNCTGPRNTKHKCVKNIVRNDAMEFIGEKAANIAENVLANFVISHSEKMRIISEIKKLYQAKAFDLIHDNNRLTGLYLGLEEDVKQDIYSL